MIEVKVDPPVRDWGGLSPENLKRTAINLAQLFLSESGLEWRGRPTWRLDPLAKGKFRLMVQVGDDWRHAANLSLRRHRMTDDEIDKLVEEYRYSDHQVIAQLEKLDERDECKADD